MFNCPSCGNSIGPRISPVTVIKETRPVSYHNTYFVEDEYGNREKREVDSVGSEIVKAEKVCKDCAEKFSSPESE